MIPKEELYYRIMDYIIKTHKGITDPAKVLGDLGLNEFIPHIGDIVSELEHKGFLKAIRLHSDKYAITAYDLSAKYFVENYLNENLKNDKNHINSNFDQTMDKSDKVLDIFISHSSKDAIIVEQFIELLGKAIKIDESRIRCTSVPGYKLPSGVNVNLTLKNEISTSKIFIGFITAKSLESVYVLFELGARWGSEKTFKLITSDASNFKLMQPPLSNHHTVCISNSQELYQILDEIQEELSYNSYKPSSIAKEVEKLLATIAINNKVDDTPGPSIQSEKSDFTKIELEILKSAVDNIDGQIRISSSMDGTTIQSGQKVLLDSEINKEIQKYKSALEILVNKGYIEISNASGNRYEFTNKAYEYLNRV